MSRHSPFCIIWIIISFYLLVELVLFSTNYFSIILR